MNVYDFDNTIYDGESSVDFFMFCIKRDKKLWTLLPVMGVKLVKYKMCLITIDELKRCAEKYAWRFIESVENVEGFVKEFWELKSHKIKDYYIKQKKDDDVVISASCSFLLNDICKRLGIKTCICSEIDTKTGKFKQICFRSNKVDLFYKNFPDGVIDNFYTDSMNDKPLIEISKNAYLVKGDKLKKIK